MHFKSRSLSGLNNLNKNSDDYDMTKAEKKSSESLKFIINTLIRYKNINIYIYKAMFVSFINI